MAIDKLLIYISILSDQFCRYIRIRYFCISVFIFGTLLEGFPIAILSSILHSSFSKRIQLMEFLVSDNFQSWTNDEDFDYRLFEEWVRSILQTQKGLKLLEPRNVLYTLYMERLSGELVKMVGPLVSDGKLDSEVLSGLLSHPISPEVTNTQLKQIEEKCGND